MNASAYIIVRRTEKLEKTWERKGSGNERGRTKGVRALCPLLAEQRFYVAAVVRHVKNQHVVILNAVGDHVLSRWTRNRGTDGLNAPLRAPPTLRPHKSNLHALVERRGNSLE